MIKFFNWADCGFYVEKVFALCILSVKNGSNTEGVLGFEILSFGFYKLDV